MIKRVYSALLVLTLALSLASTGCKTAKKADDGVDSDSMSDPGSLADANALGDSDSGKAMGLKTINFPYDSFTLTSESKTDLKNNAQILKDNSGLKIQIEGHCDTRGGIQYNIALGEKRATAVKKYLEDLGVKGDRIATISFGKEKLIDMGSTEEAHAKNRRANFVITSK